MCGFAGIVSWDNRYRVTRDILEKMSARIAHRGPDGAGIHISHEEEITPDRPQVALAHRRLAILDLDPRANQPFTDNFPSTTSTSSGQAGSERGGRWLVFNGEIYNFRELRRELEPRLPNYAWRTQGDTEVLLAAYAAWGERCVEHLNGMFAFAIWDEHAGQLFMARDRMGQKPLYWAAVPGAIAFASELSALRELPFISTYISNESLLDYLSHGYISAPATIYKGIRTLPPATCAMVSREQDRSWSYFDPNDARGAEVLSLRPHSAPAETAKFLLQRAVRRQLVADVPVGCFLSGGIDSSIIASAMKAAAPADQEVLTFCIGFDDERYDETEYAEEVARHLGTLHLSIRVKPDAAADLPKLAAVFGEPFGDSSALPTHYLARETRRYVKVALSGDGGDELFGGYDRYRAMGLSENFGRMPPIARRLITHSLWQKIPGSHPKLPTTRLKRLLRSLKFSNAAERYQAMTALFTPAQIQSLLPRFMVSPPPTHFADLLKTRDAASAAAALDRIDYLPGDLLTKVDRASMLHALEVRSPFMDHDLVQFAAALSGPQLLRGGAKRLLREAFAHELPASVFKRRKMGFAVPIGEWFRGPLRSMLRNHLFASNSFASRNFNRPVIEAFVNEHEQKIADHSQRLYALLMLELWARL